MVHISFKFRNKVKIFTTSSQCCAAFPRLHTETMDRSKRCQIEKEDSKLHRL